MSSSLEIQSVRLAEGMSNGAASRVWHPSAPKPVRQAFRAGRSDVGWDQWAAHLRKRRQPVPVSELLPGTSWPLSWALPDEAAQGETPARLKQLQRLVVRPARTGVVEELAGAWLSETPAAASVGYALEALAWAELLPPLAGSLTATTWCTLVDRLLDTATAAEQLNLEEAPLLHQLLAGELRLTLAYLLPELAPCRSLMTAARTALSSGLCELLDADGPPQGQHLNHFRPLLACWTRCRAIGEQLSQGAWNAEAEGYYQWLVRAALRLTRADGSQVLSPGSAGAWCRELFEAALALGGDEEDQAIAALALPGAQKPKGRRSAKVAIPVASNHSEWAAVSVLRTGWPRPEPRLTVVYPGKDLQVELESGSELLCSGQWRTEVLCEGKPLEAASAWEEVCWVSDEDIDYLELELPLEGDWRLQRHLALARKERVLLMADSVLGSGSGTLEYRTILPLATGIRFQRAEETQEGYLVGKKRQALVLPLALPEWRCAPSPDWLQTTERGLELQQTASGPCLFAPLWFDLDARRLTQPRTWRQLTVAENRQILPRQTAVGYRVMTGKRQWLVYRSLAKAANRTLLGHNLSTQMLLATFQRGEVEPLVEIE